MNNELDTLIVYCDDMIITTESFETNAKYIAKEIWIKIKYIFKKISIFFKNFIRNINMFKECKIPKSMNDDMLNILQTLNSRAEQMFIIKNILFYTKSLIIKRESDNELEDSINDTIFNCKNDILTCINEASKSNEYDRFINENYTDENLEQINMPALIKTANASDKKVAKYSESIDSFSNLSSLLKDNAEACTFISKVSSLCNMIIRLYNMKISIISKVLSKAKASLSGTKENLNNLMAHNKKAFDRDYKPSGYKIGGTKVATKKLTDDNYKLLKESFNIMKKENDYNTYKKSFDTICTIMAIPKTCCLWGEGILSIGFETTSLDDDTKTASIRYFNEKNNKINILQNTHLYHTSSFDNISELTPKWTNGTVFWATPRVYVSAATPINRYGVNPTKNDICYEIKNPPNNVYVDRELGGYALYIETSRPLPVITFNYDEWRKEKEKEILKKEV